MTDDEGIFRVDTVPPPGGEDDAYSAPTKIGVLMPGDVERLMAGGSERPIEIPCDVEDLRGPSSPAPALESVPVPVSAPPPAPVVAAAPRARGAGSRVAWVPMILMLVLVAVAVLTVFGQR